jgi:hypothetical protein
VQKTSFRLLPLVAGIGPRVSVHLPMTTVDPVRKIARQEPHR